MIVSGSMVALKGHHRFPMIVQGLVTSEGARAEWKEMHKQRMRAAASGAVPPDYPPADAARCVWLGTNGQPYEATYPLEILEEIDE